MSTKFSIDVKVYDNGDHTAVVWMPSDPQPIPGCLGFAIRRDHNGVQDYLHGFVGFSDADKFPADAPWKWPLQRYLWWDYSVRPNDKVKYQVIPVIGSPASLRLDEANASAWTAELTVTGQCTDHISTYFNKGIVAAQ